MGRTNKLVDGCYSFWQGGLFPLLQKLMPDYLAQTSIPFMPSYASSSAPAATAGSGSGSEEGNSNDADVAVEEEEVLQLTARSPERQALDDLFRTKVRFREVLLFGLLNGICVLAADSAQKQVNNEFVKVC